MYPHISFDIETLGTTPGSAVISIGAVNFCPEYGALGDTFYANISIKSNDQFGLRLCPDTIEWWLRQSDEARKALLDNPRELVEVINSLTTWVSSMYDPEKVKVWGHGAPFDITLIESVYHKLMWGDRIPWKFWNVRDTRTIYDLSGEGPDRTGGTHHKSVSDAIAQAKGVIKAYRKLGLSKKGDPEEVYSGVSTGEFLDYCEAYDGMFSGRQIKRLLKLAGSSDLSKWDGYEDHWTRFNNNDIKLLVDGARARLSVAPCHGSSASSEGVPVAGDAPTGLDIAGLTVVVSEAIPEDTVALVADGKILGVIKDV